VETGKVKRFILLNTEGKLIKKIGLKNYIKELPKGIYFVQVLVEDDLVTLKFVRSSY